MRYLVPALLLAGAVGLAAPAFAQSSGEKDAQKQEKEAVKPAVYNVGISGMSWGASWVRSVKKTASALEGVDTAEVDFEKEMLTITMKEGKTLTKEDLETAFKDGKFKVTSFATAGDATEKKEEKEDPKEEEADGDSYNVGISGMGWAAGWPPGVRRTIMRLDGVKEATVSYENSNVVILMKEGKTLTEEQLKKAFEGSKFSVTSFKKAEK